MTNYSYSLVISCKLTSKLLAMLVSARLDIITANNNIAALGNILSIFLYLLWLSSKYITDTCSLYYGVYRLG